MYGNLNSLDHIKYADGCPRDLFQPKRDSAVLFSRLKRMSSNLKTLGRALNSGNGGSREWATPRLANITGKAGEKASLILSLTLSHGDPMARAAAAEAICKKLARGDRSDLPIFHLALEDEIPYVRWRAMDELFKSRLNRLGSCHTNIQIALRSNLSHPSEIVRLHAAKAISSTYYYYSPDEHKYTLDSLDEAIRLDGKSSYFTEVLYCARENVKKAHDDFLERLGKSAGIKWARHGTGTGR